MKTIGETIADQEWLEPVEKTLDAIAETTLNQQSSVAQKFRNFLHGTWLGHPLHPVITDVPIGAWSAAAVMDIYELAIGDDSLAAGSDAAVGVGLLGAVAAAIAGLNDWQFTSGKPKRVGAVHALFNIGATGLYAASWFQRRSGSRRAGIANALAGYALSMVGAYLGGHLVYDEKIGVNHAPEDLPQKFVAVLDDDDLPEGEMRKADAQGTPIVLVRRHGQIHALAEACAHLGGPLSEGKLEGASIRCPWHGSRFALADGAVLDGPSAYRQPCFETRVRKGQIEVRAATPA